MTETKKYGNTQKVAPAIPTKEDGEKAAKDLNLKSPDVPKEQKSTTDYSVDLAVHDINNLIQKVVLLPGDNAIQAIGKLRGAIIKLQA